MSGLLIPYCLSCRLSFGSPFPGMHNPLDGVSSTLAAHKAAAADDAVGMYQYFVKVRAGVTAACAICLLTSVHCLAASVVLKLS